MSEFAPVLKVTTLNGSTGFRLDGDAGHATGNAVTGAGDVNGDGRADLLIGASANRGAYVMLSTAASPAVQTLNARLAANTGYFFSGEAAGDHTGNAVSSAGDVNGDGFDDLLIGAFNAHPDGANNSGAAYLVFGGANALEAFDQADGSNNGNILLSNLTPSRGYRFDGAFTNYLAGFSVAGGGDVNGDGFADLIIGSPYANVNGGTQNGASYIVFGGLAHLADLDDDDLATDGHIDLAQISVGQGARLDGERINTLDESGNSVAIVGDVNGDGFADALVGAPYADPNSGAADANEGAAYLVFGQPGLAATVALLGTDGANRVRFNGVNDYDYAGNAVNGAGDINGDGLADMVIGAHMAQLHAVTTGSAYVVFGRTAFPASVDLAGLNGADGFRLDGLRSLDATGVSVASAGDVNGDGFGDLSIAAHHFDPLGTATNAGALFIVFGKASGFGSAIDLGALNGNDGFRIEGAAGSDELGLGVSGPAGDINGDGFDDIVVSAAQADSGGATSGSTYVIYGHRALDDVIRVGTGSANKINGGMGDDQVSGLAGNDSLKGWEGDDILRGGGGNDTSDGGLGDDLMNGGGGNDFFYASAGDDTVQGGSGADLLSFGAFPAHGVNINLAVAFSNLDADNSLLIASIENVTGTNFNDTLTGNGRANTLQGSGGNDALSGGANADVLVGGPGNDSLTGGANADIFDFGSPLIGNIDTIADFTAVDDTIRLRKAIFTVLPTGPLAAGAFDTGTAATQADDRIIYNTTTHALLYDADGLSGVAGIQFAIVNGTAPTAADFLVI